MNEVIKKPHIGQKKPNEALSQIRVGKSYTFNSIRKNPLYEDGLKPLVIGNKKHPFFESCLYSHKSDNFTAKNGRQDYDIPPHIYIKTKPKWLTDLVEYQYEIGSGELVMKGLYTTNDFKRSNGRKIKKLDAFCKYYQPLYEQRKVTLWFLTFTRSNYANLSFKQMNDIVLKYYKREGIQVRGFLWTYEISKDYHWHYHLCLATDRVNIRGKSLPMKLKFDNLWGQRTKLEFVKKNIRHYMAKYFAKCEFRLNNKTRNFGTSKKYI